MFQSISRLFTYSLFALLFVPATGFAQDEAVFTFTEGLAIEGVSRTGRTAIKTDAVEYQFVTGEWSFPSEGDVMTTPDSEEKTWTRIEANDEGWLQGREMRRGYLAMSYEAPEAGILLLNAQGHSSVYVNGELRQGDPYGYGYVKLPVEIKAGRNEFVFRPRWRVSARLIEPEGPAQLNDGDLTLPDLIVGKESDSWGAAVVINSTRDWLGGLVLRASLEGGEQTLAVVPPMAPLSVRKIGFRIAGPAPAEAGEASLTLSLMRESESLLTELDSQEITLGVREPHQSRKATFISGIDGSVQYYALQPASPVDDSRAPGLVLSVHGASVEAINQANAYASKRWAHIVAPTNRRPYGFDWEEWGRMDAMEVYDLALKTFKPDPARLYLTGHSMGGHGTWQLGAHFPDRFAAIAPSAGWISFWSYASRGGDNEEPDGAAALIRRSQNASDTLLLKRNYSHHGVYILHGGADETVPASEAQRMVETLSEFHHDFDYHEEPGKGHWWDISDEPGADCVDWRPMFDFFARRSRPSSDSIRRVSFTTVNPAVSSSCYWAGIAGQQVSMATSSIDIQLDPHKRRFVGDTHNVSKLTLNVSMIEAGGALQVILDNHTLENIDWPMDGKLLLSHGEDGWGLVDAHSLDEKSPLRAGPFKEAFQHRMVFVYGTQGTSEENQWALDKARFDAEQFWYRGNGSIDIIADVDFDPAEHPDRGVILYGHSQSNAAWSALLSGSPVQASRGSIAIGDETLHGDSLACLFVRPRPDSDIASVAAVSGSGITGMRLTTAAPYFVSGVGYPDVTVFTPQSLRNGTDGFVAAGFFGPDWSLESGDIFISD